MIDDFLAISIVGVALSLVVQYLKHRLGTDSWGTKLLTLLLAIGIGAVYVLFQATPVFTTVLTILGAASTVYAFVLK